MEIKKKKKGFSRRREKINGLKLTIEDNQGKASTYFVPVKKKRIAAPSCSSVEQVRRNNRHKFWKIADNSINNAEKLIGKKIVLKRGNTRIDGIVRNVSCSCKSPEGEPILSPPQPRQ